MEKKGTVAYVGGFEMPDRNAAAHRVKNNARILAALGYDVVFCGVDKTIPKDAEAPLSAWGFPSYPARYPDSAADWLRALYDFGHVRRVLDAIPNLTFVFAYNMHARPFSLLLRYSKKRGVKVIADVTEWYGNRFTVSPVGFLKWRDTERVMKRLHKKVDGMIAISRYLADYYGPSVPRILQLPPLVDPEEEIWHSPVSDRSEKVEFVYSGQPGRGKDQIGLIVRCFASIAPEYDFLFRVIGITEDEFCADFPEDADRLGLLSGKIVFCGRVSHAESVLSLRRADYCVFIREATRKNTAGFPTKFAECASSGVGVIANRISNIEDYFPRENGYLLESTDEDRICAALIAAISAGKVEHNPSDDFDYRRHICDFGRFLEECDGLRGPSKKQ